ncbi:MAG: ImuA family protein [Hyphomonas sp.]
MEITSPSSAALPSTYTLSSPKNHGAITLGRNISLAKGRVHEIQGDSAESLALTIANDVSGPIIWCGMGRQLGALCPWAIQPFIDPARLLLIEGVSRAEVLWAGEQALHIGGAACVIIELSLGPNLTESRRLQLACEENGAIGILLINGRTQSSAAETRWQCDALPDAPLTWKWRCLKNRKGDLRTWRAEWQRKINGSYTVHLATAVTT